MAAECAAAAEEPLFGLALEADSGASRADSRDCRGSFVANDRTAFVVVAHGGGGYEGGEIASAIAAEATIR